MILKKPENPKTRNPHARSSAGRPLDRLTVRSVPFQTRGRQSDGVLWTKIAKHLRGWRGRRLVRHPGDGDLMMRFLPSLAHAEAMRRRATEASRPALARIVACHPKFNGGMVVLRTFGAAPSVTGLTVLHRVNPSVEIWCGSG